MAEFLNFFSWTFCRVTIRAEEKFDSSRKVHSRSWKYGRFSRTNLSEVWVKKFISWRKISNFSWSAKFQFSCSRVLKPSPPELFTERQFTPKKSFTRHEKFVIDIVFSKVESMESFEIFRHEPTEFRLYLNLERAVERKIFGVYYRLRVCSEKVLCRQVHSKFCLRLEWNFRPLIRFAQSLWLGKVFVEKFSLKLWVRIFVKVRSEKVFVGQSSLSFENLRPTKFEIFVRILLPSE